ncbi:curli-like amyloid fiber formation chaperone CsgH [Profundibacterium mesophilum]|uniref:Uncharacterized protein n=1 Tax=Profundibacterium mesophilum KAUST100406-0324 TaxID=1037889 RepID=A0A921TD89_9RHOB|nr:curli-like amyloid fiber formation chaperone CsgH [Profundibacterium mesophilum]KAF0676066.1 hypothetical protein PMES_01630 [Profundibacterium mesophilum KAUST100406-0324]
MHRVRKGFTTLAAALIGGAAAAGETQGLAPLIIFDHSDGMLSIEAVVEGWHETPITAAFTFERQDGSGRMRTRQSREIDLSAGGREIVATTRVSVTPQAWGSARLVLLENGEEVGRLEREFGERMQ